MSKLAIWWYYNARWFALAGIVGGFVVTAWLFALMFYEIHAHGLCMKAGYPRSTVTWRFDTYCARRVNGTDSVVPLVEAP